MAVGGMAEVPGARIAWWADGDGPETIVLVHAGVSDARMWDGVVPALAAGHRVVRYDMRGYGRSRSDHGARFTPAGDLEALLDELGIARAHVVGASFGGQVALQLALTAPARVASLVLLAASLPDHEESAERRAYEEAEEAAFEAGNVDEAVELNLRMWVDGPARTPEQSDPDVRALVAEMIRNAVEVQDSEEDEMLDGPAVGERLREIDVTTTVAVGELDLDDYDAIADRLVGNMPQARLERIAGAAHLIALERPDDVARLIARHVEELSPPASPPR